jgi:UDP-N-acetylglucosamine 2-epimerase (non-hydrolysing)
MAFTLRRDNLRITLVVGTRPQIIKSAPLIHLAYKDEQIRLQIVHTGQHYDYEMTKIFFEELDLPDPDTNLGVGSGTHAEQTAKIMLRLDEIWKKQRPDLVLVPGDTNSTLAGALTAAKLTVPVAHVEAGARSYDMKMPEEINRRLTDHCSSLLFTSTENCTENLVKEGIERNKILQSGDPMYDVLLQQLPKAEKSKILQQLKLKPKSYALLTTHRPENTDDLQNLKNIADAMIKLKPLTIVFPVHPRTKKQLEKFRLLSSLEKQEHVKLVDAIGYHETLKLMENAALVLTDSGGMQKEAFWLRTPCITMRENTEWIETVQLGANCLTGANAQRIVSAARQIIQDKERLAKKMKGLPNPFGNGKASQNILEAIRSYPTGSS